MVWRRTHDDACSAAAHVDRGCYPALIGSGPNAKLAPTSGANRASNRNTEQRRDKASNDIARSFRYPQVAIRTDDKQSFMLSLQETYLSEQRSSSFSSSFG